MDARLRRADQWLAGRPCLRGWPWTAEGLTARHPLPDGRKSGIRLTSTGAAFVEEPTPRRAAAFDAIAASEKTGHPLHQVSEAAAQALERRDFRDRLRDAEAESGKGGENDAA